MEMPSVCELEIACDAMIRGDSGSDVESSRAETKVAKETNENNVT